MEPVDLRDPDRASRLKDDGGCVGAAIDPMSMTMRMTSRLDSCRLHFFLIPAKTCRISALLQCDFAM
jgi:hypothetical protein